MVIRSWFAILRHVTASGSSLPDPYPNVHPEILGCDSRIPRHNSYPRSIPTDIPEPTPTITKPES
jgi:hypothetical protein